MGTQSQSLLDLARRIEADLRQSGLSAGDRCPSTAHLARGLRVSTRLANNALRILVKRGVLTRRQRVGTVLTDQTLSNGGPNLQRVHLMVHADFLRTEGLLADDVLIGLQEALPGSELRYDFIPAVNLSQSVERIVAEALRQPEPEGFVMVRAPLEIQRLIQASGLPAVVYGGLQPSVTGLPQIDWDQRQMADLAVAHLLKKRCRRFAVLLRRDFGPGDAVFMDRVQERLAAAGVGLKDLLVRGLPPDEMAVAHAVAPLIRCSSRKLGIICRSRPLAEGVRRALESPGPRASRPQPGQPGAVSRLRKALPGKLAAHRVEVVIMTVYLRAQDPTPPFPFIQPVLPAEEIGRRMGGLLGRQAGGHSPEADGEVIPVELRHPKHPEGERP